MPKLDTNSPSFEIRKSSPAIGTLRNKIERAVSEVSIQRGQLIGKLGKKREERASIVLISLFLSFSFSFFHVLVPRFSLSFSLSFS